MSWSSPAAPEGQGRRQTLLGVRGLGRLVGEDERSHRGVAGVRQAERGVVLDLRVGVREGLRGGRPGSRAARPRPGRRRAPACGSTRAGCRAEGSTPVRAARVAQLAEAVQGRLDASSASPLPLGLLRLGGGRQREQGRERRRVAVAGQGPGGPEPDVGVGVLERLRPGRARASASTSDSRAASRTSRSSSSTARTSERLRGGRVLLDQGLDRRLRRSAIARAERGVEELQPLRLLEANSNASARSVGSGSLKNSRSRSQPQGSATCAMASVSTSRRTSAWMLLQHEAERPGPAPADLEVQRRLERLGADRREAVVQGPGQHGQGRASSGALGRRLAELGDQELAGRGGGRPRTRRSGPTRPPAAGRPGAAGPGP